MYLYESGNIQGAECYGVRWGLDCSAVAEFSTSVLLEWVTPPVEYKQSVVITGYSSAVATAQIRHWPCVDNGALI